MVEREVHPHKAARVDLCIRGGTVVTMDSERRIIRADVYVDQGRIIAVGGAPRGARRELKASGMLVIPGMQDLHNHLRDLHPGLDLTEGLKLDAQLRRLWRLNRLTGPAEYRIGAALGTARLLKAGVTSVVDHIYPFHRPGLTEAALEGYKQSGIRWFMARGIMTRGYRPISESARMAFRSVRDLADGLVPKERLFIAPVSFRQATVSNYLEARRLADRLGLRLYTHIAETREEVSRIASEHGLRPVALLHRLGFAGPDTVMVHCVLLSKPEIKSLARSGTHVVHCPTSHMKLAKGVTPVPSLLAAGVNVCLGVDEMDDLFVEMRQEVLLQGNHYSDPAIISPQMALEMATVHGASALGLGDELGSIEPGRRADLVCVDPSAAHAQPVLDPVWSLVHRLHGHDVAHVVVDGQVTVENGELTKVDERALVDEARDVIGSFLRRTGITERQILA